MKDEEFKVSREVCKSKRSEERICWTHFRRKAVWRPWARASLKYLRVRWFLLTIHFGHRARHEARQIKFGDIALRKNKESGEEYLEWTTERERIRPKNLYTEDHKKPITGEPILLSYCHWWNPEDKIWFVNSLVRKQNWPVSFQRYEKFANVYER